MTKNSITQNPPQVKAFGTDLTKHEAFEQGPQCFIWTHPDLRIEVELRFRFYVGWQGWKVRCLALGIETTFEPQDHGELAQSVQDWIEAELNIQKAADLTPPKNETIWETFARMVETEEISLTPLGRLTIWESGDKKVDIFCTRYNTLCLVAKNGKVTTSRPLAFTAASDPQGVWRLGDNAKRAYQIWREAAQAKPGPRRPLWHYRPAVDELMFKHSVGRNTAAEMYKEKK